MEYVRCNLCGADHYNIVGRKGRYNIPVINVICKNCGLVYVNPRFDKKEHKKYYSSDKYKKIYFKVNQPTEDLLEWSMKRAKKNYDFFDTNINFKRLKKKVKKILDIGCSDGAMLYYFKNKGWQVSGIEPSAEFAKYGKVKYGLDIKNEVFEEIKYPKNYFDLISLVHTLEHVRNPEKTLKKSRELLNKDGFIYIEVPNIYRPEQSIKYFFQDAHLYSFSPTTITSLLNKVGLEIIKINNENRNLRIFTIKGRKKEIIKENYKDVARFLKMHNIKYYLTALFLFFFLIRSFSKTILIMFGHEKGKKILKRLNNIKNKLKKI